MAGTWKKIKRILLNGIRGRFLGAHNRQLGTRYREENAVKPGVVTRESGLQYEVLRPGEGPQPGSLNQVEVHYRGSLIDGTEFDSSYDRGEPMFLHLYEVIPGWSEGLRLMSVGSHFRLVVPPELAYGPTRAGLIIGPESTLVFEVELLAIHPRNFKTD